jgi:hypothetical protein
MDSNQTTNITLSKASTPVPILQAYKEVPQIGISSKGNWDVNSNGTNYDFYDEKPISYSSANLTPSATGDGTFTNSAANTTYYDVANATYDSVSNAQYSGFLTAYSTIFNNNGTKAYATAHNSSGDIYQYSLSTAYDVSTNTYDNKTYSFSQFTYPTASRFNGDGTKLYTVAWNGSANSSRIWQYSLSTAYDISTASYDSVNLNLTAHNFAWGFTFNNDGSKVFVSIVDGGATGGRIAEYSLSTNYDLSTAGSQTLYVLSGTGWANYGIEFNNDGTKLFVNNNDDVPTKGPHIFTLSTAYDISTVSYTNTSADVTTLFGGTTGAADITFNNNGSKMYISDSFNGYVRQFSVSTSTAFNAADVGKKVVGNSGSAIITATSGTYTSVTAFADTSAISSWQLFGAEGKSDASGIKITGSVIVNVDMDNDSYDNVSVSNGDTYNHSANAIYWDTFNDGVTRIYTASYQGNRLRILSSSSATADISSYTLQSAYDTIPGGCNGIYVPPDGSYVVLNRNGNDSFVKKTATTAYTDFGSDVYTSYTSLTNYASGLTFNADGSAFYIINLNNGGQVFKVPLSSGNEYTGLTDTSTWGTVESSATNLGAFGVTGNPLSDLRFNQDGTKLFITQQYGRRRFMQFNLSTPYDIRSTSMSFDSYQEHSSFGTGTDNRGLGFDFRPDFKKACFGDGHYASTTRQIYQYTFGVLDVTAPTNQYIPTLTNSSTGQINSSSWLDINSMTADETKNDGDIFYAVSTDNRTSWSIAKASDGVRKIARNNSGTWQYNNGAVVPPAGYLIPASFRTGHSSSLTVTTSDIGLSASEEMIIRTPVISDNGTKLTWMNRQGNEPYIVQYNLSTPYDISTGTFSYKHDMGYSGPFNFETWCFNTTGTKIYITGSISSTVTWIEHTLSTAWDLSTASYTRTETYTPTIAYREDFIVAATNDNLYTITEQNDEGKVWSVTNGDISTATVTTTVHPMTNNYMWQPSLSMDGTKLSYTELNDRGDVYIETLATPFDFSSSTGVTQVLSTNDTDLTKTIAYSDDGLYAVKGDGVNVTGDKVLYAYSTGTTASGNWVETDSDWTNGTYNNEHATLQQALTSQAANRMNKAQLDAVADGYHFSQDSADTLDLMIAPYAAPGVLPISDGVTINYDAASKYRQAVPETDYRANFAGTSTVEFTSIISANFKVKVV